MFIKFENLPVYGFLSHRFQGCRSFLIALQSKTVFSLVFGHLTGRFSRIYTQYST